MEQTQRDQTQSVIVSGRTDEITFQAPIDRIRSRLRDSFVGLSEAQREALAFASVDGLTYREIAKELGVSAQACKTLLRDGLLNLQPHIPGNSQAIRQGGDPAAQIL